MKRKVVTLLMIGTLIAGMAGCGFTDGVKQGAKDALQETSISQSEKEEASVSAPEADTADDADQTETSAPEENVTGNPLLDAEVKVGDVMNGTKTAKLGEYAYVVVPHATMNTITMEQYADFCNQRVTDSGYNWVTIDFADGTGLQFAGSSKIVATYGTLDEEKCIVDSMGTVALTGENTWEYTPSN